jgi:hypothetical protein
VSETVLIVIPVDKRREAAAELLAAADKLGLPPRVVESQSDGYLIPVELAEFIRGEAEAVSDAPKPAEQSAAAPREDEGTEQAAQAEAAERDRLAAEKTAEAAAQPEAAVEVEVKTAGSGSKAKAKA